MRCDVYAHLPVAIVDLRQCAASSKHSQLPAVRCDAVTGVLTDAFVAGALTGLRDNAVGLRSRRSAGCRQNLSNSKAREGPPCRDASALYPVTHAAGSLYPKNLLRMLRRVDYFVAAINLGMQAPIYLGT